VILLDSLLMLLKELFLWLPKFNNDFDYTQTTTLTDF